MTERDPVCRNLPPHGRSTTVRLTALLLLLLSTAGLAAPSDPAVPDAPAGVLTFALLDPLVIRPGIDTFRLIVGFSDPSVIAITLSVLPDTITVNGEVVESIRLAGNGNGVFSVRDIGLADPRGMLGWVSLGQTEMVLHFSNGVTSVLERNLGLALRFVDPSLPEPVVEELAADARATSHALSIVQPLSGTYPYQFVDRREVANRYYDFFPDDRDFLLVVEPHSASSNIAFANIVRNDVLGIGVPLFDLSGSYGSNGVLQHIVSLRAGSVASFGILNHEIYHRWAAYLGMGLNDAGSHWGVLERPTGAGRDEITQVSDTLFRTIRELPNDVRYSDLELYVGGLLDLSEVAFPIRALENPVFAGIEPCPPERSPCSVRLFEADRLLVFSEADLLAVHGPRVPASSVPVHYRAGLVVAYDRLLTPTELAYYDIAMREYEKDSSDLLSGLNLRAMTWDRATVSTALQCEDPDGDSVCGVVDRCPTIPNTDQDPEVCDQRIVDVEVELASPLRRGSGTIRWRTTHEVNLLGFHVVAVDPRGRSTRINPDLIECLSCTTGEGHAYEFLLPRHSGGRNLFVEAVCDGDCPGMVGPAVRLLGNRPAR